MALDAVRRKRGHDRKTHVMQRIMYGPQQRVGIATTCAGAKGLRRRTTGHGHKGALAPEIPGVIAHLAAV